MKKKKQQSIKSTPKMSKALVAFVQFSAMLFVFILLFGIGVLMFRKPFLERYFEKKTGYVCEIGDFDLNLTGAFIELHNIVIQNRSPYPETPMGSIRRIRLEWDPGKTRYFPKQLKLLEIEVDSLTLIRMDGNKFNVLDLVESLVAAWGQGSGGVPLTIDECWLYWEYLIALDQERKDDKRMEVLLEYEGSHKNVTRIREITDPAMLLAKQEVDGYYFMNYLTDGIKGLLK